MAGCYVEHLVADMRGDYLLVTIFFLYFAEELFQTVTQGGTFRQPQRQPGTDIGRKRKKFHLFTKFAVVAFLRLLKHYQIFIQHLFLRESDTIDTHQLVAFFVATPVCACKGHHLGSLDYPRRRDVRPTAKVGKRSLRICCDMPVFQFGNQFALVFLPSVAERLQSIGFGNILPHNLLVAFCKFEHFALNGRKIGRSNGRCHNKSHFPAQGRYRISLRGTAPEGLLPEDGRNCAKMHASLPGHPI